MKELIAKLNKHGKEIGRQSDSCEVAADVVKFYTMLHKSPGDPAAKAFLEIAYEKWEDKYLKVGD